MVSDSEVGVFKLKRRPRDLPPVLSREVEWAREWNASMGDWFDTDVIMIRGPELKRLFELIDALVK